MGYFPPGAGLKPDIRVQSDYTSNSGGDEEADNQTMTRMLEDVTGRLVYIGDASTLSFLALIRMIVETTAVDSFFINTHALVEVFDEKVFLENLDKCYSEPLTVDHIFLCHLNLVFAIGLSFATPEPGSQGAEIINSLRTNYPDQSEVFYMNAKSINNPVVGFEDADLWSVQALLLMALYMLLRTRRNPAYAYIGMAVRTAYTLGLHREDTLAVFPIDQQSARRNLWRSLFVLDRFLSASLGRPMAIADEECSGEILNPSSIAYHTPQLNPHQYCTAGMEAVVRSCHVVGIILKKVYLQRKISTKLAEELANQCRTWPENLPPALHWRQATRQNRRQAIAILHSNQVYCHSIILLTRPFFLYLLSAEIQQTRLDVGKGPRRSRGRMEKLSDACLIASQHTVALVQNAYEGHYLPKVDPFATYCLFAAALIIFSNEFARPASSSTLTQRCIENSITIMSYFGEMDPMAKRNAHVLIEFAKVIPEHRKSPAIQPQAPAFQSSLPPLTPDFEAQNITAPFEPDLAPTLSLPGASSAPPGALVPASNIGPISPDMAYMCRPSLPQEDSFSGLLDLTNTVLPSCSEHGSGSDEFIEFDSFWTWPPPTPSLGLGTMGGALPKNVNGNEVQEPFGGLAATPLFEQT
ncbi:fungal-specific transcription factor domain-containing protein [Usnea florida]